MVYVVPRHQCRHHRWTSNGIYCKRAIFSRMQWSIQVNNIIFMFMFYCHLRCAAISTVYELHFAYAWKETKKQIGKEKLLMKTLKFMEAFWYHDYSKRCIAMDVTIKNWLQKLINQLMFAPLAKLWSSNH